MTEVWAIWSIRFLPGRSSSASTARCNPAATLGRRLVYEGKEYYVRPDDWTDAAFRSSLRQEYNASISGQTGNASIYGSFGYLNNEGIAYNSDMDRYTARLRVDYQAKKWLKFGANANYTHFRYNQIDDSGAGNSSGNVFAYTTAVGPIYPLYIRDGEGNVMYNEDGIKLYDYGDGGNAGLEPVRSSQQQRPLRSASQQAGSRRQCFQRCADISTSRFPQGVEAHVQRRRFASTKPARPRSTNPCVRTVRQRKRHGLERASAEFRPQPAADSQLHQADRASQPQCDAGSRVLPEPHLLVVGFQKQHADAGQR